MRTMSIGAHTEFCVAKHCRIVPVPVQVSVTESGDRRDCMPCSPPAPTWHDLVTGVALRPGGGRGRRRRGLYTVSVVLFVAALLALLTPIAVQMVSQEQQARTALESENTVSEWPSLKQRDELRQARAYNARIARGGQTTLGEVPDPFSAAGHATRSATDRQYQSLLDISHGIMGTIAIPKISLTLPIYHGTSDAVLAQGIGHLYGTSLPVGGASTNSVLTGHRGLPNALLFTRIDELRRGNVIYIKTLNKVLAYKVDGIRVVKPEQVAGLIRVRPGEDRITLMTCTPYGVNTQRLLIFAKRAAMPQEAPYIDDAPRDHVLPALMVSCLVAPVGVAAAAAYDVHARELRARHTTRRRLCHARHKR